MNQSLVGRVVAATGAVCFINVPIERFKSDSNKTGLYVLGTGFLVRPKTIITNRHVIDAVEKAQATYRLHDDELYVVFAYPTPAGVREQYCSISVHTRLLDPKLDIGFIELEPASLEEFKVNCQPLQVTATCNPAIGEAIAIAGYPYGVDAHRTSTGRFYRFGPVFQQGYVSAIAPFYHAPWDAIEEILLDIRTAEGMSGAAVVRVSDGVVIGVHWGGMEATLALAVPLDNKRLAAWLAAHDAELAKHAE